MALTLPGCSQLSEQNPDEKRIRDGELRAKGGSRGPQPFVQALENWCEHMHTAKHMEGFPFLNYGWTGSASSYSSNTRL